MPAAIAVAGSPTAKGGAVVLSDARGVGQGMKRQSASSANPPARSATCVACEAEFSYRARGANRTRCDRCRSRRRETVCRQCGERFRYTIGRGGKRTRCNRCRGFVRRCHGCNQELCGRSLKWCAECRPTRTERARRYYEREGAKIRRRVARNRKVCAGCGARLLKAARRCGFCEVEDPLARPVPA